MWCHSYQNAVHFEVHILQKVSAKSPKCVNTSWLSECDHSGLTIDDQTRIPFKRYLRWTFDVTWQDRFVSTSDISINSCRSILWRSTTRPASYAITNCTEVLWSAIIVISSSKLGSIHCESCGHQAQMQTSSLLRLQSETVHCKNEPIYWVLIMFCDPHNSSCSRLGAI